MTLFSPLTLRGVTLPNRIGVSPMCMYSCDDGAVTDFHIAHLGRFALGGAGLVIAEATAVDPIGRISHRDAGLYRDDLVEGWARVARVVEDAGAVAGIQLSHAGRRACVREPWNAGAPVTGDDGSQRTPWRTVGPSPIAAGPGFPVPDALDEKGITASVHAWRDAAARAVRAGFRYIELHGAHGYLLHEFLSPLANHRTDRYGGSAEKRMRYPLEVVSAVRAAIGPGVVLAYRVSAVDGVPGGLTLDDTVAFAQRLAAAGVDVVDTSSGGISTDHRVETRVRRGYAFHADFSRRVRKDVDVAVATVGMVVDPHQAGLLVERGDADLVLVGRQLLDDPNWAHHARKALSAGGYGDWDVRHGHALAGRARAISRLAEQGETPMSRFER
ncbi:NADH:flavin oxidoreductase/NADH oxidase [Microbacterium luticocti]|uniref:NADH:flavin oxidoreductase/NADH oxidase n=1 Tax=Microbacterium luticocti TaxID=451764 RepID=UPI00055B80C2|nr:NADH:flavin oxidoreductase/NADH oxidase [Microbacterium luticocti]